MDHPVDACVPCILTMNIGEPNHPPIIFSAVTTASEAGIVDIHINFAILTEAHELIDYIVCEGFTLGKNGKVSFPSLTLVEAVDLGEELQEYYEKTIYHFFSHILGVAQQQAVFNQQGHYRLVDTQPEHASNIAMHAIHALFSSWSHHAFDMAIEDHRTTMKAFLNDHPGIAFFPPGDDLEPISFPQAPVNSLQGPLRKVH